MDVVFNALGDPVRIAIVDSLSRRGEQSLFEIVARLVTVDGLSISRQAVSKHLAVLVDAGIVHVERSGRTTLHTLQPHALASARAWLTERLDSP